MKSPANHLYEFEVFSDSSEWIFVTPSDYAKSLGIYVLELGHFIQDGYCYTERIPEDSFIINVPALETIPPGSYSKMQFHNWTYVSDAIHVSTNRLLFVDNLQGYTIEQYGASDSYFIVLAGKLAREIGERFHAKNENRIYIDIEWKNKFLATWDLLSSYYRYPSGNIHDLQACMLLMQILTRLLLEVEPYQQHTSTNQHVTAALRIIEEEYDRKIKLQDVADMLHLNPSYLSRLIHAETGTTFSGCLRHARLNHAKQLLVSTNLSIEEIGGRCGFCDSSHFIKQFTQIEKITPFQFRNLKANGEISM